MREQLEIRYDCLAKLCEVDCGADRSVLVRVLEAAWGGSRATECQVVIIRRGFIAAVVVVLVAAGSVCADLTPFPSSEVAPAVISHTFDEAQRSATGEFGLGLIDSGLIHRVFLHSASVPFEATGESQSGAEVRLNLELRDRGSLDFCLYALISLGLCRSGHWVKRSSFALVPAWYHSGAPLQIGHSLIAPPDSYCPAAICFLQPDGEIDEQVSHHRTGMVVSLWRCSQFTPSVLASRAPPRLS